MMELAPNVQAGESTEDPSADLNYAVQALRKVTASPLAVDERSYWSLPEASAPVDSPSHWRSPGCNIRTANGVVPSTAKQIPMRVEGYASKGGGVDNAILNFLPEPIITHEVFNRTLLEELHTMLPHFAKEDSLAQREYGQPMLVCRADVVPDVHGGADVQICEVDDVASLWATLARINPIAASYIMALEQQMGIPIYSVELFEFDDNPNMASVSPPRTKDTHALRSNTRHYFHNDDHWRGNIFCSESWLLGTMPELDEVALIVRARPEAFGFKPFMDAYGPRSITMAWNRDSRKPLIESGLAV